jgi:TonB family protein
MIRHLFSLVCLIVSTAAASSDFYTAGVVPSDGNSKPPRILQFVESIPKRFEWADSSGNVGFSGLKTYIRIRLSDTGQIRSATTATTSGNSVFDAAAIEYVKSWVFRQNVCVPKDCDLVIPILFAGSEH